MPLSEKKNKTIVDRFRKVIDSSIEKICVSVEEPDNQGRVDVENEILNAIPPRLLEMFINDLFRAYNACSSNDPKKKEDSKRELKRISNSFVREYVAIDVERMGLPEIKLLISAALYFEKQKQIFGSSLEGKGSS